MPKTNIDYSKTIIYKIINYDCPDLVYVGSTTNFTKRKQQHKSHCVNINKSHDYKIYKTIRGNGNWDSWSMLKICDYPCNNNHEAKLEEDKHMMELKANMNMRRATRTKEQYCEDYKDKLKEYREDNKDKMKQYREDNKDKIKEYRENNKDKLKEHKSKKCTCECGAIIQHCIKAQHIKTIKHQKYLKTIGQINVIV